MPSKKLYDMVFGGEDADQKALQVNEEVFKRGINFQAKYVGTLDIPRPTSRIEIVAAMRRVRFEFKAKAIKKQKVVIEISVDGVKVSLHKKNRNKLPWRLDLLQHPIFRIFYVSHDSQDLKIFSYITSDDSTKVFRCSVFKSFKKNQAVQIVRTIGQAFDVCHKISLESAANAEKEQDEQDAGDKTTADSTMLPNQIASGDALLQKQDIVSNQSYHHLNDCLHTSQTKVSTLNSSSSLGRFTLTEKDKESLGGYHQMQLLRQQMLLQKQQTEFVVSQMQMLKDHLAAETAARIEAQTRTHQLMKQNHDLLEHINVLVHRLMQNDRSCSSDTRISDPQSSGMANVYFSPPSSLSFEKFQMALKPSTVDDANHSVLYHPNNGSSSQVDTGDSPDSGHNEMSLDSISCNININEADSWFTSNATKAVTLECSKTRHRPNGDAVVLVNGDKSLAVEGAASSTSLANVEPIRSNNPVIMAGAEEPEIGKWTHPISPKQSPLSNYTVDNLELSLLLFKPGTLLENLSLMNVSDLSFGNIIGGSTSPARRSSRDDRFDASSKLDALEVTENLLLTQPNRMNDEPSPAITVVGPSSKLSTDDSSPISVQIKDSFDRKVLQEFKVGSSPLDSVVT